MASGLQTHRPPLLLSVDLSQDLCTLAGASVAGRGQTVVYRTQGTDLDAHTQQPPALGPSRPVQRLAAEELDLRAKGMRTAMFVTAPLVQCT